MKAGVARHLPSWDLTNRQLCDLELLLTGAFSPLRGFLTRQEYESVCTNNRLKNGTLWPIPIVLDVSEETALQLEVDSTLALRDPEGILLAVLHVKELWQPDRAAEARAVYGTLDREHPGVAYLLEKIHPYYVGGDLEGVELPSHYDFSLLRLTPAELRSDFARLGWGRVVAFQPSQPMHRAEFEMTLRVTKELEANLLIHPAVGLTKPNDADYYTRVRCYQAILPHYPAGMAKLALIPLATRMAGTREAIWNAIVRKNYGCTHFIIDNATESVEEISRLTEREVGVEIVRCKIPHVDVRGPLSEGKELPESVTFSTVEDELRRAYPPRSRRGFTIFFTGLSGAGKSTIAKILLAKFLELGDRAVTLLDGDIVRKHLSSELGFSREHRDINIRRIGFVASEITKHGGIAICAPIAPYDSVRKEVRAMTEAAGGFVLVYVATPLEVCEQRDRKGLYAKARMGLIQQFTGISDPYEAPEDAELVLNTTGLTPNEAAETVMLYLEKEGYIGKQLTRR
jgi:sulfate adenylyltransferase